MEKIEQLEKELEKYKADYQKMLQQYSETRAGSCYGVEYFEIQLKVLNTMIWETSQEIVKIKKSAEK